MPQENAEPTDAESSPAGDRVVTEPATITVRPSKAVRPKLRRLSSLNGRSEGQIILESLEAIVEMIAGGFDFVPQIVQRSRLLLTHLGRSGASGGMLGGDTVQEWERQAILPSEIIQNLSPRLTLLPVLKQFPVFHLTSEQMKMQATEQIAVPADKIAGATFAYKPSLASREKIDGRLPEPGEIFLLSFNEPAPVGSRQFKRVWSSPNMSALARHNYELVSGPIVLDQKGNPVIEGWPEDTKKPNEVPVEACDLVTVFHSTVSPIRLLEDK